MYSWRPLQSLSSVRATGLALTLQYRQIGGGLVENATVDNGISLFWALSLKFDTATFDNVRRNSYGKSTRRDGPQGQGRFCLLRQGAKTSNAYNRTSRGSPMSNRKSKPQSAFMVFMNLHDTFMNAELTRSRMTRAPIPQDPDLFMASPRGQFERMWITFLYVLVEAWCAPAMASGKAYIRSMTAIADEIDKLIDQGKANGNLSKMQAIRNYMCHRDKREYWDAGRTNVAGQFIFHKALHSAFSRAFLAVAQALKDGDA